MQTTATTSNTHIASFTYDGDGRRVIATEAGTTTVFIGNYFEWKNSAMTKYYYAGGQRLADLHLEIIAQRFAPAIAQGAAQARQWLSVAVTPEEHQVFTIAWRGAIGYINSSNPINTATATVNDVLTAAQRVYTNYPALLDAAKKPS